MLKQDNILMITVKIVGGLGNQLFQLALTKNLQKKYPNSIIEIF